MVPRRRGNGRQSSVAQSRSYLCFHQPPGGFPEPREPKPGPALPAPATARAPGKQPPGRSTPAPDTPRALLPCAGRASLPASALHAMLTLRSSTAPRPEGSLDTRAPLCHPVYLLHPRPTSQLSCNCLGPASLSGCQSRSPGAVSVLVIPGPHSWGTAETHSGGSVLRQRHRGRVRGTQEGQRCDTRAEGMDTRVPREKGGDEQARDPAPAPGLLGWSQPLLHPELLDSRGEEAGQDLVGTWGPPSGSPQGLALTSALPFPQGEQCLG